VSEPWAETREEGSEADRLEQQVAAWSAPEVGDEPDRVEDDVASLRVSDSEASEGDLIEQALPVPLDEEEDRG
jgi:hypothetical protein